MRFNRTFMELKQLDCSHPVHDADGFNRTFMELKRQCHPGGLKVCAVLIGPSWN